MRSTMTSAWQSGLAAAAAGLALAAPAHAAECDDAANHPEWVFCHDFEASDADDFGSYWNDIYGAGDRMFLIDDNAASVEGSHSLRMQVVNNTNQDFTSGVTSGPKKFLGDVVDWHSLYYRRYLRFNDDFHQGNFMHLGGMSACHPSLYPWGCMGHAGERPNGDDRFSTNLEPWSDYQSLPWPGRWGFYSYYHQMYMDCGHPGPDDCYGDMFAPSSDFFTTRGEWHVYEMAIEPGTPGQADGSQTFWVDGQRIYTATGIAWRTTDQLRPNQVGLYLYLHYNPANTTNILDADNVLISRQYIGPAPCQPDVAIDAACLCGGAADPDDGSNAYPSGYCCSGSWQQAPCGTGPDGGTGGSGTGGTAAGGAGTGGTATGGSPAHPPTTSEDDGCGCRHAGARPSAIPTALVVLVITASRRRGRRRRCAQR